MHIAPNVIGLVLIGVIVWWFWLSKAKTIQANQNVIQIIVKDGVYTPARIQAKANKPITIEFLRQDQSACSEYVVFSNLDVHEQLPLNQPHSIHLGKLAPGTYPFACQMNMYAGELVVT
jgi:plastocyanin domain-containing protein